jgi:hypothetical protein
MRRIVTSLFAKQREVDLVVEHLRSQPHHPGTQQEPGKIGTRE